MHLPTLRQLYYLTVVTELKHFGKAAEKCFVTQSTLSAGIQDLEDLLGAPLLERTNRKVLVTPLGKEIAERAQTILSLSEDLVERAKNESDPLSGRIRLGIIPSISPFLLPIVLPKLRAALPNLELVLTEQQSDQLIKGLQAGEIDVAVLAFPFDTGTLQYALFGSEPFWVALPKQHPLAKQDFINASQLPNDKLMLLTEGHCLRDHALSVCNRPNTHYRTSMEGTSLYTLIEMVAGGLGITLLPEMAIYSDMVQNADITVRPFKPSRKIVGRELGLVWRSSYKGDVVIEQLQQHFKQALKLRHHSDTA